MPQCAATVKHTGSRCRQHALLGGGTLCAVHGDGTTACEAVSAKTGERCRVRTHGRVCQHHDGQPRVVREDRQCAAKSKRSGVRCRKYAVRGGRTCHMHGSGTKAARAAADRELEARRAAKVLGGEVPRIGDLVGKLRELVDRGAALEDALWSRLKDGGEGDAARVGAYVDQLERLHRMVVEIEKLGLAGRLVELEERQAAAVVWAIAATLKDLGLSAEAPDVKVVLARNLREAEARQLPPLPAPRERPKWTPPTPVAVDASR